MKTVYQFAWTYKWPMFIALTLTLFELVVELAQPLFIGKIIDEGIIAQDSDRILFWGGIMLVAMLISFASGVLNSFLAAHVAQSFAFDVRQETFRKLQAFSLSTFLRFPTASLMTRLTTDVNIVQQVLFMGLRIMTKAPLIALGSIVMAFVVHPQLASIFLVGVPFLLLFLWWMVQKGGVLFGAVQRRLDRLNRTVRENLRAIRLVKSSAKERYESERFDDVAKDLRDDTMKAMRTMEWTLPILLLVMNGMIVLVVGIGSLYVDLQKAQVGEVVSVMNYALRMTGSFSMFSFLIVLFSRARASATRIEEVLVEDEVSVHTYDVQRPGDWHFDDVTFRYGENDTIHRAQLHVKEGERIAIIGETGAGKTTLVRLLLRLFEPNEGTITYGTAPLTKWDPQALRQQIGYVPQEAELVSGTIRENLRWGKEDATDEALWEALRRAQLEQTIHQFDHGLDTPLGQHGVNLSGGQKQRLSIARALLRKPHTLILDDSTSALDVKTEAALMEALEPLQMTTWVITQKVSTARRLDRIFVMERGRIVGIGTDETLYETNETYRRIVQSQREERLDA